jgi:hypothetical protein
MDRFHETFSGDTDENGFDWLEKLELYFSCCGRVLSDEGKVGQAILRLKGSAWDFFQVMRASTVGEITWASFVQKFRAEYAPDALDVAMAINTCRQQPTETVMTYATRFRRLLNQANITEHQVSMAMFISGLFDNGYRSWLRYHRSSTLEAAIDQVCRMERADIRDLSNPPPAQTVFGTSGPQLTGPTGQANAPNNGSDSAADKKAPVVPQPELKAFTEELRQLKRHLMSSNGHQMNQSGQPPRQGGYGPGPSGPQCYNCDEYGHISRERPHPRRLRGPEPTERQDQGRRSPSS